MEYGIHVKISGAWQAACNVFGEPYCFATRPEAWTMARVLFPDLLRAQSTGGEITVRIVPAT
jgi:hypothetical protein